LLTTTKRHYWTLPHQENTYGDRTGMALTEACTQNPMQPVYTHYTSTGTSRFDRFYVSKDLLTPKQGIQILPAAFTNYRVVALRIAINTPEVRRGSRRWKMNPYTMDVNGFKMRIRQEFKRWRHYKQYYPDVASLWVRCVKKRLRQLIRKAETELHADERFKENQPYRCIYDVIRCDIPEVEKVLKLERYKAKIVRLRVRRRKKLMLEADAQDKMEGEEPASANSINAVKQGRFE